MNALLKKKKMVNNILGGSLCIVSGSRSRKPQHIIDLKQNENIIIITRYRSILLPTSYYNINNFLEVYCNYPGNC